MEKAVRINSGDILIGRRNGANSHWHAVKTEGASVVSFKVRAFRNVGERVDRKDAVHVRPSPDKNSRKKFVERTWRYDETFSNYFYDKMILANKVPVDKDEITDYLIDGIPDEVTRNQVHIQRFERKEDLLQAFKKIMLRAPIKNHARVGNIPIANKTEIKHKTKPQTLSQETAEQNSVQAKYFNCNRTRHVAKSCDRLKRERGSCYECGAINRRLRDCPQRKRMTTESKAPQQQIEICITNLQRRKAEARQRIS